MVSHHLWLSGFSGHVYGTSTPLLPNCQGKQFLWMVFWNPVAGWKKKWSIVFYYSCFKRSETHTILTISLQRFSLLMCLFNFSHLYTLKKKSRTFFFKLKVKKLIFKHSSAHLFSSTLKLTECRDGQGGERIITSRYYCTRTSGIEPIIIPFGVLVQHIKDYKQSGTVPQTMQTKFLNHL